MKKTISIAAALLTIFVNVHADDPSSVRQGAVAYDWQTCVDSKANSCINSCANSSDINCSDKCTTMAKDKCVSEGISQPQ